MNAIEEYDNKKTFLLMMFNGVLMYTVMLIIDAAILWYIWNNIMTNVFKVPSLSTWQALGLLCGFRILTRKR